MNRHWNAVMAVLGVCAAVAAVEAGRLDKPPRPFPKYSVEVIHGVWCPVVEYEPISGRAVNAHGDVAGELTACDQDRQAFRYPAAGGPLQVMPLPPVPGPGEFYAAFGADLSDAGWLVGRISGTGMPPGLSEQGFVSRPDGTMSIIPSPPQGNHCEATGVNAAGQVVGWWANITTGPHRMAYRWENGIRTDLTELRGPKSEAFDISESGLITGWTGNSSVLDACAFILWEDGTVTELPPVEGGTSSIGYSVNDYGDICGQGWVPDGDFGKWRAFASIDGEMIMIPPLPGWTDHTSARGINSHGQVVGGSGYGFIWQDNVLASLQDLVVGPPGLIVSGAQAITDDGRIVTSGNFADSGDALTFLLTPIVPSPGDLDGDGFVNALDVVLLLAQWGQCHGECSGDLDDNGLVNGFDLAMLLASWTS